MTLSSPILRVGIYSLLVNGSLVGIKLALSFIAGSLALRADAIHSLVDVFASIALITGLIISGRKSQNFPYGLYKVENVVSVIISVLLFVTAYEIIRESVSNSGGGGTYPGWLMGIVGALILVPFFFGRYEVGQGRKFNSPSLIADGTQFRADVLSASVVLFALIGERFGIPLDRIAASLIALFIVRAGWQLLSSSMRVLLDASIDQSILDEVRSIIVEDPAIDNVITVMGRNSGRFVFIETTVALRTQDLEKAHAISERIESNIKNRVANVDRVLIHYEPKSKTVLRYVIPLSDPSGIVSDHFGEASHFALLDFDTISKTLISQQVMSNPHQGLDKGKGIKVAEFLLEYKPDIVITRESLAGKGPGYAFDDYGVKMEETEYRSLKELIDSINSQL